MGQVACVSGLVVRDVAFMFGRLMTVGDGVSFVQNGRLTRGAWIWSGDPTLDQMEEEECDDFKVLRFWEKFKERGSVRSGKLIEIVERQLWD